jgi:hypothetical protein
MFDLLASPLFPVIGISGIVAIFVIVFAASKTRPRYRLRMWKSATKCPHCMAGLP